MQHDLANSLVQAFWFLGLAFITYVVLRIQYLSTCAQWTIRDACKVRRGSIIRGPRPHDAFAFAKLDGGRRFLAVLHAGAQWEGKCLEPDAELPFRKLGCPWLGYLIVFKEDQIPQKRWLAISWLRRASTRPAGLPRLAIFSKDILDALIATMRRDLSEKSQHDTGVSIQKNAEARRWYKGITYFPCPYTKGTPEARRFHIDWLKAHMRTRLSPEQPSPPTQQSFSISEAIRILKEETVIGENLGDDQIRNYLEDAISEMWQEASVIKKKRVRIQKS